MTAWKNLERQAAKALGGRRIFLPRRVEDICEIFDFFEALEAATASIAAQAAR